MHKYKNTLKFWWQLCLDTLVSLGDFFPLSTFPHCQIVFNEYILFFKTKNFKDTFLNYFKLDWKSSISNDQEGTSHNEDHNEDRIVCFQEDKNMLG